MVVCKGGKYKKWVHQSTYLGKDFRAHRDALSSNHGPGNSIRGLCSGVGAAIPTGGSVNKALDGKSS